MCVYTRGVDAVDDSGIRAIGWEILLADRPRLSAEQAAKLAAALAEAAR